MHVYKIEILNNKNKNEVSYTYIDTNKKRCFAFINCKLDKGEIIIRMTDNEIKK